MLTIIALVVLKARASDPFARFEAFAKEHPSFKVQYKNTVQGKLAFTGSVLVERPLRTLFEAKDEKTGSQFTACNNQDEYSEFETNEKLYSEGPPNSGVGIRGSEISDAPGSFPGLVFLSDLRRGLPKNAKVILSTSGSQIYGSSENVTGKTEIWVDVNSEGEVPKIRILGSGGGHTLERTWTLDYSFPTNINPAEFETKIPLGYEPNTLPEEGVPIQKGGSIPVDGWKDAHTGSTVNLLDVTKHDPFLLAILDDSAPSKLAALSLAKLGSQIPVEIVAAGQLTDPDGSRMKKLGAPGSPMFYLVDGTGKVRHLWFGFHRGDDATFRSEVVGAASAPVSKKS